MKRVPAVLGIVASLVLWAGVSLDAQEIQRPRDTDYTEDAEDALDDADDSDDEAERQELFQEALTNAQAEIAENPNNPLGYRLGAFSALGLEQYPLAGEYFDRATELYPLYEVEDAPMRENAWIELYQEAGPFLDSGDYEGAAAIFENAHAIYRARPEIMITLAQLYSSLGETDKALEFMDVVDEFMASDVAATTDPEALAGWRSQASILPPLKAQVLMAAERYEEAVSAYDALIESDPDNLDHQLDLAAIHMNLGNQSEALELYGAVLASPGLTGPDYYAIGVGFYNADDYENAVRGFSGAAEQNARDRDAIEMWTRSLQLDSLWSEVPAVARRWVELDPRSQSGWAILAQAANLAGDTEVTQEAMNVIQGLDVSIDQLELRRRAAGGGIVYGTLVNKTLDPGTSVTIEFTFFGEGGGAIGSVSETVNVRDVDTAQPIETDFSSSETVGGYSYEVTVG